MSTQPNVERFYTEESPEELRLQAGGAQHLEFQTACAYLDRFLPPASRVLDSCAGTGAYAFYLAGQGHTVTAGDLVPRNVQYMQNTPGCDKLAFTGVLDALDLSCFADETFDAVLCMGALYHLHQPAQRSQAVRESLRVLAPGGLLFATYMNRYAVIQNNAKGSVENLGEMLHYAKEGTEGVFYASTPEESTALFEGCGAKTLCHLSLDGVSNFLFTTAGLIDETGLKRWGEYHLQTCEVPSLLGAGYHNMLVLEKPVY